MIATLGLAFLAGVLSIPLQIVVGLLTAVLSPFAGGVGDFLDQIGHALGNTIGRPRTFESSPVSMALGILLIVFVVLVNALAIYFFVRWLLLRRNTVAPETDPLAPPMERAIVRPSRDPRPAAGRPRFGRRAQARDAVSAYLAALAELDSRSQYARLPSETPAAHARRVRLMGMPGGAELSRLAADYQLARYGDVDINQPEDRRAVVRFERLRKLIRATPARGLTTS